MRLTVCLLLGCVFALPVFSQGDVEVAPGVVLLGTIQNPEIAESSGIAPSKRSKSEVFWTHNDSGVDKIYAINSDGVSLAEWKIKNVEIQNAEDISPGNGRLFLADIGNNDGSRKEIWVHALPEPPSTFSGELAPVRSYKLEYPGDEFDSESFFTLKSSGYIVSKELSNGEARLYRFPLNKKGASIELEKLGKLNVNSRARGASISKDGKKLAIITGNGAYLFSLDAGLPAEGDVLDPVLFVPFEDDTMEGCALTANGLVATSEGRNIYLFTDPQFQVGVKGKNKRK